MKRIKGSTVQEYVSGKLEVGGDAPNVDNLKEEIYALQEVIGNLCQVLSDKEILSIEDISKVVYGVSCLGLEFDK